MLILNDASPFSLLNKHMQDVSSIIITVVFLTGGRSSFTDTVCLLAVVRLFSPTEKKVRRSKASTSFLFVFSFLFWRPDLCADQSKQVHSNIN